jgi:CRISPR system Cascade subunit CasA
VSERPAFDLLDRPWIPVTRHGVAVRVGLRALLINAHELDDLAVPVPPAAAMLWRVLYALAARVTGLAEPDISADAWHARRGQVVAEGRFDPERIGAYLDRVGDRFDLFHPERPWLQDPRLRSESPKSAGVDKLVLGRPAGNNQVWFDHHHQGNRQPLPAPEATWQLLAQLGYGPAGMGAVRMVGATASKTLRAGPLRGALSFHPLGADLFESLVAGLFEPDAIRPDAAASPDLCAWEADTLPNPLDPPSAPTGPCSLLTRRGRHALLLTPSQDGDQVIDARLTWAFLGAPPPAEDPYLIYQRSQQGNWYARHAEVSRAIWRDLDALLLDDQAASPSRRRPLVIEQATQLPAEIQDRLRLRALGFVQDGKTRDAQWFSGVTPPVLRWLSERDFQAARGIELTRTAAEAANGRLTRALGVAANEMRLHRTTDHHEPRQGRRQPDTPWTREAAARYWPQAEHLFWRLVTDRVFADADGAFTRLALSVYDEVTDQALARPRSAKAVVEARGLCFPPSSPIGRTLHDTNRRH